ncbi:hypothetical protein [Brevibacterium moorei]|uniref:hypothetical protein n=1 Tax=Brevibacterium moorei TaxID=2968457 RepID=UPI00211BA839|nr:hypothetical protein [Brevibacterium sp. 68QC2CO]MCQ9386074.1 hypothetical protein [Brevibacterium sp. 68QC2CO]
MRTIKPILGTLATLALVGSLTACGGGGSDKAADGTNGDSAKEANQPKSTYSSDPNDPKHLLLAGRHPEETCMAYLGKSTDFAKKFDLKSAPSTKEPDKDAVAAPANGAWNAEYDDKAGKSEDSRQSYEEDGASLSCSIPFKKDKYGKFVFVMKINYKSAGGTSNEGDTISDYNKRMGVSWYTITTRGSSESETGSEPTANISPKNDNDEYTDFMNKVLENMQY